MASELDRLRAVLRAEPSSLRFRELAEQLRRHGELAEAEAVLRAGLSYHPEEPGALLVLGRVLLERGRSDEGIGLLESLAEAHPERTRVWTLLAEAHERAGNAERSAECLRRSVRAVSGGATEPLPEVFLNERMAQVLEAQGLTRRAERLRTRLKGREETKG
jgi:predicted Zn-dependent protease